VTLLAVSTGTAILSLAGLALGLVVLVAVVILFQSVLRPVLEIRAYADDILEGGLGIARNLDSADELVHTRDLATSVPPLAVAYLEQVKGKLP
jgi:nitrogen fixation/metabolism regulation signal transduction histidine kinase